MSLIDYICVIPERTGMHVLRVESKIIDLDNGSEDIEERFDLDTLQRCEDPVFWNIIYNYSLESAEILF